ncbi:MAG: hypothetical protein RR359_04270 [Bacilli bacterium]
MNVYLKKYLKLFNYGLIGAIFALSSFYLIINIYHYKEIRKEFIVNVNNDDIYLASENAIKKIKENIDVDLNKYKGNFTYFEISAFKNKISDCVSALDSKEFVGLKNKSAISIIDMYNLTEQLDNEVIGKCIINNLGFLGRLDKEESQSVDLITAVKKYTDFPSKTVYINMLINNISTSDNYMKKDMINNSSYYYNTNIVTRTLRNGVRDSYGEYVNTYAKASRFIEEVSNWFREETKGAR